MFGLTEDDFKVFDEIESRGYSVAEAYEKFRAGELPDDLEKIIQDYESRLLGNVNQESS